MVVTTVSNSSDEVSYPSRTSETLADFLRELGGINARQARKIAACFELARPFGQTVKITRPTAAFNQVKELRTFRKEHLIGLYLDAQNALIAKETLSIGSLNTTRTHPREILLPAIVNTALGFILVHNHPSGCLDPSEEDIDFTRSVAKAATTCGIELYDHLIVATGGFTSLRERGCL
jgi:DNA repair protein RadC